MKKKVKNHFINGAWVTGEGEYFISLSPIDNCELWSGYFASKKNIDDAVISSIKAFKEWSLLKIEERVEYLKKFVSILEEEKSGIAEMISKEIGKPLWESLIEVNAMKGKLEPSIKSFNERCKDSAIEMQNGSVSRTRNMPHGVIAVFGPYNFPGHMPNGQILPALLAGNTVIFKPSESAPASSEKIMDCWEKAKLPVGVINMLQGDYRVGEALCKHPKINGVFFTGGKTAGLKIRQSLSVDKICVLEMGGNSPLVVWDSSDIKATVIATINSAFITSGQRCSCARRLIVPNNEFGNIFLDELVMVSKKIIIGKYDDHPEPYMGPVRHKKILDNILTIQEILIENGAESLLKSQRIYDNGNYITPGIIDVTNVDSRSDIEIMGPFLQVIKVKDFSDAINEANNTEYGLAAGLFSERKELYDEFVINVKAGIINWNQQLTGASPWAPFGGIKSSGNFHPAGYSASDFCSYKIGSIESNIAPEATVMPKGICQ